MNNLFKGIEKKTGVKMDEVMNLVKSFTNADLNNEATVRDLIQEVGYLAGKRVPKQTEDKIVKMIIKNKQQINASTISKMIGKK